MEKRITVNGRRQAALYLTDYRKYWIHRELGIRNEAWNLESSMLLDLKNPHGKGYLRAVNHFSQRLAQRLSQSVLLTSFTRHASLFVAIVPRCQAGRVAPGLRRVAAKLCSADRRFLLPTKDLLVRTRNVDPRHDGAARSSAVHLNTIAAELPAQDARPAILLLDDIATTGNSLAACAQLLYRAGAKAVIPVVLGWTASHG